VFACFSFLQTHLCLKLRNANRDPLHVLEQNRRRLFWSQGVRTTPLGRSCSRLILACFVFLLRLGNDEGIEARNEVFKVEAPKLAVAAAERALADWGGDRHKITHVIAVTCTGVIIPGLEFELMTRLALHTAVQRLSLVYMGNVCFLTLCLFFCVGAP
jgi:hypothetical protein